MSFSNSSGGTLALPSPTHAHQIDVTSAVRTLRRSMSRSPSKFLSRSNSRGSEGSQQASPQSPCRRFGTPPPQRHQLFRQPSFPQSAPPAAVATQFSSTTPTQSPQATPFRSSVKLSLRSAKAKTATPSRPLSRTRASPRSPLRRALNSGLESASNIQIFAPSSAPESPEQENRFGQRSPAARQSLDKPSRHSCHLDVSGSSQNALFLRSLDSPLSSSALPPSGSLKRSDATMNLDQPAQGSPVAKRRSLHGISSSNHAEDLSIFGSTTPATPNQNFEIHEDANPEYELAGLGAGAHRDSLFSPTPASHLPKRTSSLRKSTLQQRYGDKGSLGRRTGERQLAQMSAESASPLGNRPRVSTDQFVPPVPRDNPFSLGSPLPNLFAQSTDSKAHQPHPLSKALSASTSGNSLEEAPLYAPARALMADRPKAHPFSQSLPLNATRPMPRRVDAVATPGGTSLPGRSAFHSTGLISKVNRNPEDEASKFVPPDTPCKKPSHMFNTYPLAPNSALKRKPKTNNRNSFGGIPSTPHNASSQDAPDTFGQPDKGLSLFFRGLRRTSIQSTEGDEPQGLDERADVADLMDGDIPPTPTRNTLTHSLSNVTESSLESPSAHRTMAPQPPVSAVRPMISRESTCKSLPREPGLSDLAGDVAHQSASRPVGLDDGQSQTLRLSSSFGRARARQGLNPPAPLSTAQSPGLPLKSSSVFAKMVSLDPASPVEGRRTPQTPRDTPLRLDTTLLPMGPPSETRVDGSMLPPPVTPTAERDFRLSTGSFATPVNVRTSNVEFDSSMTQRFDHVEQIGKGEYSSVYRVTKTNRGGAFEMFNSKTPRGQAVSPARSEIYAVKQSRHPYNGIRDRDNKLREVQVLQALRDSEHVVQYIDHWEHNLHLFIQTEFCEEGTLEKFLANSGRSGRLDDFRIFKILEDLLLGLKEIHDAGFMHLDMKPANILITFEGALKIADFGHAQSCSTVSDAEEGDREYMAPEVLQRGKVDKAADMFSTGLIALETAANIVLPENGPIWSRLRSGDLSDVPSLTWVPSSNIQRDITGNPIEPPRLTPSNGLQDDYTHNASDLFGSSKQAEIEMPRAPDFMLDPTHWGSLEQIVRWMTVQEPEYRPVPDQLLDLESLRWVAEHRTAPATVYEGNWGPDEPLPIFIASDGDTEMTDA